MGWSNILTGRRTTGCILVDRIWVPVLGNLRTLLLSEAHNLAYLIHPGSDKMYFDLRDLYWWPGMKRDVAQYVSECVTCLQVKAEHKKPLGLLVQPDWCGNGSTLLWTSSRSYQGLVVAMI